MGMDGGVEGHAIKVPHARGRIDPIAGTDGLAGAEPSPSNQTPDNPVSKPPHPLAAFFVPTD